MKVFLAAIFGVGIAGKTSSACTASSPVRHGGYALSWKMVVSIQDIDSACCDELKKMFQETKSPSCVGGHNFTTEFQFNGGTCSGLKCTEEEVRHRIPGPVYADPAACAEIKAGPQRAPIKVKACFLRSGTQPRIATMSEIFMSEITMPAYVKFPAKTSAAVPADATSPTKKSVAPLNLLGQAGCKSETAGTCRFFGCKASRGATSCVAHKCVCKPGTCNIEGVCGCTRENGQYECNNGYCLDAKARMCYRPNIMGGIELGEAVVDQSSQVGTIMLFGSIGGLTGAALTLVLLKLSPSSHTENEAPILSA